MNENKIWNFLIEKIKNPYGVAALMGNLFAESSLNPVCACNIKKHGLTNVSYTAIADSGVNDNFITDKIAYGIAQWCYHTRKKGLLELARKKNKSVGDIDIQLEYLWTELQAYKTVLNALLNAKSIREASDVVLLKYEKPSNKSEAIKEKRASYGQKYFNQFSEVKIQLNLKRNYAEEIIVKLKDADVIK